MLQLAERGAAADEEQGGTGGIAEAALDVAEAGQLGEVGVTDGGVDDSGPAIDVGPVIIAFQTDDEKAAGATFTPCCSRARGTRLVIDL